MLIENQPERRQSGRMIFGVLVVLMLICGDAKAQQCIDTNVNLDRDTGTREFVITNTCKSPVNAQLRNQRGKVCEIMRLEPNVTRTYRQLEVCGSANDLTRGCACERELRIWEQRPDGDPQPH